MNLLRRLRVAMMMTMMMLTAMTAAASVIYVSSSEGDDSADGSERHPLRTIARASKRWSDTLLLRRGDIFYENIKPWGRVVAGYGEGPKPTLSGWKTLERGHWEQLSDSIWRLDMERSEWSGRVTTVDSLLNNIGLIRELDTGRTYGRKVAHISREECHPVINDSQNNTYLQREMDFYQNGKAGPGVKLTDEDFRWLYLRTSRDPRKMKLQVTTYGNAATFGRGEIRGLHLTGFSCNGAGCGTEARVYDCDIDHIGGAQQTNTRYWVRYGNGIEFYVMSMLKGCRASGNRISHTFDCGTTIQGSGYPGKYPADIVIERNVISNCRQAFEYFLNNGPDADSRDCYFRDNICIDSGDNGFGAPERRDAHILSYQRDREASVIIEGNTFIGSAPLLYAVNPALITVEGTRGDALPR